MGERVKIVTGWGGDPAYGKVQQKKPGQVLVWEENKRGGGGNSKWMDARDVRPAWELLQRGETSEDPRIRATQERLQACSYAMAHPESGTLVPACAQHSVLDPAENVALAELLPRGVTGRTSTAAG